MEEAARDRVWLGKFPGKVSLDKRREMSNCWTIIFAFMGLLP